jgi:hypothetical protein
MNMVSYKERERLMRELGDDRTHTLAVVFKCMSCLVLLVVIALIGIRAEVQPEMVAASAQTASAQYYTARD